MKTRLRARKARFAHGQPPAGYLGRVNAVYPSTTVKVISAGGEACGRGDGYAARPQKPVSATGALAEVAHGRTTAARADRRPNFRISSEPYGSLPVAGYRPLRLNLDESDQRFVRRRDDGAERPAAPSSR